MAVQDFNLCGCDCMVSRSGYTGEDGFEISVAADQVVFLTEQLLRQESVALTGLGARDSLRMEAGLCLYGQDMDSTITPVEAGLTWAISPIRRPGRERQGGFPGAGKILDQITNGADKKLVGLIPEGRAPIRHGVTISDNHQKPCGEITSGGFSPSLGRPISMGYVPTSLAVAGCSLFAEVRGKQLPVTVTEFPFVPHRYHR